MTNFFLRYLTVFCMIILSACSYKPVFSEKNYNFEISQACIFGQVPFLPNIMFLTQLVIFGGRKNDFSLKVAWFGKEKSHLAPLLKNEVEIYKSEKGSR